MKEYYCEACGRKHNGKYSSHYCRKHIWQIKKYGKLLDNNPRTKFDQNEFRFKDGYVEFDTYNEPKMYVNKIYIIDTEEYPRVSRHKWRSIGKYATTVINGECVTLQRFLMEAKPGQTVDHIDINPLNNRKSNLRITTQAIQNTNRKSYNKLGTKGVEEHINKYGSKYSAYFRNGGKQYHSPCYSTREEAMFARFILEQMFCDDYLFQEKEINLSEEKRKKIIKGLEIKFNK